jgi:hypothetical protein
MKTTETFLKHSISPVLTVLMLVIFSGCGEDITKPASGTLKVDGKLVSDGTVEFFTLPAADVRQMPLSNLMARLL